MDPARPPHHSVGSLMRYGGPTGSDVADRAGGTCAPGTPDALASVRGDHTHGPGGERFTGGGSGHGEPLARGPAKATRQNRCLPGFTAARKSPRHAGTSTQTAGVSKAAV